MTTDCPSALYLIAFDQVGERLPEAHRVDGDVEVAGVDDTISTMPLDGDRQHLGLEIENQRADVDRLRLDGDPSAPPATA